MKAIPLIRAAQLEPYLTFLDQMGAASNKLLEQSKIKADVLSTPEQLLPEYQVWDFIERAGRANGSAIEFGLQTGLEGKFEFLIGLMHPCLTAYDALNRFCLLTRLHSSQATFWLFQNGSEICFCRKGIPEIVIGQEAVESYTLMLMINLVRYAMRIKHWQPSNISVQMKRNYPLEKFKPLTNIRIKYSHKFTAIAIDATLLSLRKPSQYSPHLCSSIYPSTPATDFVGSLRQVMASFSEENPPCLGLMAKITGFSPRSLQRRLREAKLSYTDLINQIQFERATTLLQDSNLQLKEISEQLGYSTQGHFTRAFKRWTGVTPQSFRQTQLNQVSLSS